MNAYLNTPVSLLRPAFAAMLALMMAAVTTSSFAAVEKLTAKLGGKKFGNGLTVDVNSGTDLISNSVIYHYKLSGKVRGKRGALRKAFPETESLAKFIDSFKPGSSASLKGLYVNPSAGFPVALRTQTVTGSRRIKGFGKVQIKLVLTSSIGDTGQVVFKMTNVRFANRNGKLNGSMVFRAGKLMVHTAPVMSFQSSNLSVDEISGTAQLIVVREGFLGMPASVQFATSDNSAVAGTNYVATTGVVSFAANEFEKTITIPVIDNAVKDKPLQFNVILSNPSLGSVLGQSVSASVRIMNDDK